MPIVNQAARAAFWGELLRHLLADPQLMAHYDMKRLSAFVKEQENAIADA